MKNSSLNLQRKPESGNGGRTFHHRRLGGAVCEVLSEKAPTPVCRIGMNDIFGESGSAGALVAKYGLDAEGIYGKVKAFVK